MKNKIIDETYKKFVQRGYSATLSEIARESGLKKQSLYNYFDNKEELFFEMIEMKVSEHLNEEITSMNTNENLDTVAQLKKIFIAFTNSFKDTDKLKFWKRLLLIENPSLLKRTKEVIKKNEYPFSKNLRIILLEIIETRPELNKFHKPVLLSYVSVIHGVLDGYLLYSDEDYFDDYLEDVWEFFAKGLKCYLKND